jgi:LysR family glycine cleavage system transcriptional activator
MTQRLPPLNALRAFDAGARYLSFTRAAAELNVTQAAVSHQIRLLERELGVTLFRRSTRKLTLTDEGEILRRAVHDALAGIGDALDEIRGLNARARTLTVSLTPTFGGRWLAERLSRFWRRHPDIDLRLHHSIELVDFARDDVDMAVRWGRGLWPGVEARFLMHSSLTPVCSPGLLKGRHPLRAPRDLRHHTLLHAYNYEAWTQWLKAAGVEDVDAKRGPIIDDPAVLDQATLEGQGVTLGRISLLTDHLATRRLVRPFDLNLETEFAYYMVYPPGALAKAKVKAFHDFLLAEAAADKERADPARSAAANPLRAVSD